MINQQYFGHDAYKRTEPAVRNMLRRWGMKGYGMYWVLMELLRESDEYRISITGGENIRSIAEELLSTTRETRRFINDLKRFGLLGGDDRYIWSEELVTKMEILEEKRQKARTSANLRWHKDKPPAISDHANAMRTHSDGNAMAMQVKESKEEKSIVNQSRVEKNKLEESMPVVISEENNDVLASVWEAPRPDNAIFWWYMKQSITDGEARTLGQLMPGLSEHGLRDLLTRLYAVYVASGRSPMPYTEFVREHVNSLDQGRYSELIEECERS